MDPGSAMRRPSVLMLVVWLAVVSVVIGCALGPPVRDMEGVPSEYVRSPKVNIIVTTAASASAPREKTSSA
jgi:hypothetical protein